ncbi:MAG: hypothetical protein ACLSVD_16245 [Eggerthellaceae bacterium]
MLALYHRSSRYRERTNPKARTTPASAHHACRGVRRGGCQVQRDRGEYGGKPTSPWAALACVGAAAYGTLKSIFPRRTHLAYEICKAPRHFGIQRDRLAVDGIGAGPSGVRAVGHRVGILNYDPRTARWWTARNAPGTSWWIPATPLVKADVCAMRVGTDLCLSLGWLKWILDSKAYDDAFVRRWTNAPFPWNPEKDGRTAKGWFMEMNGGIDMESRILTEADCDPSGSASTGTTRSLPALHLLGREQQNYVLGCRGLPVGRSTRSRRRTGSSIRASHIADAWLPTRKFMIRPTRSTTPTGTGATRAASARTSRAAQEPALFPGGVEEAEGRLTISATVWRRSPTA